ncbi:NPAL2-like protein [Mya arenaria]|uniref:NPAL2-like protein n=1 Tax=Mya arenaria TaxID=6604 RepID=A0ABY7FRJ2_MYAAR|nr:NPAL2-like protein [Mya arenaria]
MANESTTAAITAQTESTADELHYQKYTHMKNEELEVKIHYTRNPLWWAGVSMMIIGEVGNFSAYANMFLAAIFLKEKIGPENLFASFSVISAKAVSSMIQLTFAGDSQLKYLNAAMKKFESTIVVPTNFVFFTISAIIAGIVFYREFWGMTALEIFMFLFGCCLSFVGVYFIVAGRKIPAAIVEATHATPGEPPVSIASKIFPAWLLATMNVGKVQPSGYVSHISDEQDESRRPFVAADGADSDSSQDTLYTTYKPEANGINGNMNYGTDEQ